MIEDVSPQIPEVTGLLIACGEGEPGPSEQLFQWQAKHIQPTR